MQVIEKELKRRIEELSSAIRIAEAQGFKTNVKVGKPESTTRIQRVIPKLHFDLHIHIIFIPAYPPENPHPSARPLSNSSSTRNIAPGTEHAAYRVVPERSISRSDNGVKSRVDGGGYSVLHKPF